MKMIQEITLVKKKSLLKLKKKIVVIKMIIQKKNVPVSVDILNVVVHHQVLALQ